MANSNSYQVRFGPQLTDGVKQLIIFTCAVFFINLILQYFNIRFIDPIFALNPNMVNHFFLHQVFTYGFLHADFMHLLFNMLNLFFFGSELESLWGKKNFFILYFASIVLGGFLTWMVHNFGLNQGIVVGASGGVFGVMVCYALLWPNRELLFMLIFPIKMKLLIPILILLGFFYGGDRVAHFAHLGGILAGVGFFFAKTKYKINFNFNFSISRFLQKRKMMKYQEEMYKRQHVKESVDLLLEKISKKGMNSLTKKEKEFLKEASSKY